MRKLTNEEVIDRLTVQLKKAIYLTNSVELAFRESNQLLEATFERNKKNEPNDMIKIFLPQRDHDHIKEFISKSEKLLNDIK